MSFQYLTVEFVATENLPNIVRVNGLGVEQYEKERQAKKTGQKPLLELINNPPNPRLLHTYLNLLGERGWEVCAALNNNMVILKKAT